LINRKEPRDMYDLWMLSKKGAEIDKKLIKLKLSEERANLSDLMFPSKKDYELGLKDLTLNLPTYDEVKRDLEVLFKGL
jgi:predicted nucleotidyltransferase component of viral defense system